MERERKVRKMERQDDRKPEERLSHEWLVAGTDSFLSGWGKSANGKSYAAWACRYSDLEKVEAWVRERSDMKRVRVVKGSWRPKGRFGHAHVYVVNAGHPALGER